MKYIKTINELNTEMINEKSNWKWKDYLIALGFVYLIGSSVYKQIDDSNSIDNIVKSLTSDVNSKPTLIEKKFIDSSKKEIIEDIRNNNRISEEEKIKVIEAINNITIIVTERENINKISKNAVACYVRYLDENKKYKKVILISDTKMNVGNVSLSHEIYHLIDDILGDNNNNYYSDLSNIHDILDKDIITKTPLGIKKLEKKIKYFIENTKVNKEIDIDNTKAPTKVKLTQKLTQKQYDDLVKKLEANKKQIILDIRNYVYSKSDYIIEPSEIFVRYNGMKKYLLRKGIIKDINDPITKKIIRDLFESPMIQDSTKDEIDHFELIFMLNIDTDTEEESEQESNTLKKLNSIVTNYKDYKNNIA